MSSTTTHSKHCLLQNPLLPDLELTWLVGIVAQVFGLENSLAALSARFLSASEVLAQFFGRQCLGFVRLPNTGALGLESRRTRCCIGGTSGEFFPNFLRGLRNLLFGVAGSDGL